MTIAVIIPVLNEARGIGQTLSHTATLGFDELVIVDGGSSDQTCAFVTAPPADHQQHGTFPELQRHRQHRR